MISILRTLIFFGCILIAETARANLAWSTINSPTSQNLWGVCFGKNLFVAVGEGGAILTSPDGLTWTTRVSGTSEWLVGVCYGNERYVVVGEHGTILMSTDAITWVSYSIGGPRLNNVAFGDGRFVAVGQGGTVATSVDAIHWTSQVVPVDGWLRAVTFAHGRFIIGGQDGILFSTQDGVNFRFIDSLGKSIEALSCTGRMIYLVGDHLMLESPDSVAWHQVGSDSMGLNAGYYRGAVSYGETLVAAGESGRMVTFISSILGDVYSVSDLSHPSPQNLNAIDANHIAMVAVGNAGTILRSTDSAVPPRWSAPSVVHVTPFSGQTLTLLAPQIGGGRPSRNQWVKNGAPIAETVNSELTLPHITSSDLGTYTAIISNPLGSVTVTFDVSELSAMPSNMVDTRFSATLPAVNISRPMLLPNGRFLVLLNPLSSSSTLQRFHSDGTWDLSFHCKTPAAGVVPLPDGKLLAYRSDWSSVVQFSLQRLKEDGSLDATFSAVGSDGAPIVLGDGRVIRVAIFSGNVATITHLTENGAVDAAVSPFSIPLASPTGTFNDWSYRGEVPRWVLDEQGRVYIAATSFPMRVASGGSFLFRLTAAGTLDPTFTPVAINHTIARLWWVDGKLCYDTGSDYYAFTGSTHTFGKLLDNGTPDPVFAPIKTSPGGLAAAGTFDAAGGLIVSEDENGVTNLVRYDSSGKRDESFTGHFDHSFISLTELPDGTLLAAGGFTSLNGFETSGIGRVSIAKHDYTTRLVNLSIRTTAGTGDQTLITGFIVAGNSGSRAILVRGVGPGLIPLGLKSRDVVEDPKLTLFNRQDVMVRNDNWSSELETVAASVGAYPLAIGSRDAALFSTLSAGLYTAHVTNATGAPGIALVELYDADGSPSTPDSARLVNVSGRANVGTGDNVLIAGFVLSGSSTKTLVIRAIGPGLESQGVASYLSDPELILYHENTIVASNDNWNSIDGPIFSVVGAFPLPAGSKDAALVANLSPGVYTAMVRGVNHASGSALVEVYEVR